MLPGSCWKGNDSVWFSTRYGNMENGCVDKDLWSILAGAESYSLSMWLSPSSIEVPTGFFSCAVQVILLRVVIAVLFSDAFEQGNLHKQGTYSWLLNVFVNCPWTCCVWSWTKLCLCVIGSSWQLCDVFVLWLLFTVNWRDVLCCFFQQSMHWWSAMCGVSSFVVA